ncbi:MAG TPA: glycine--tRNA ligase [Planctomycetaceae bacterium]|nr:glycine--tRNA ligase [Planctomycetaceae bacterium]
MPTENRMEKIVALAKRRGFIFQSSEIYGGLNGFWDYGPLGVELKRNVRQTWWADMITEHDELFTPPGAPSSFDMVGVETSIIMHPQVWKNSGHFDLFVDKMIDCKACKSRFRFDHAAIAIAVLEGQPATWVACETFERDDATGMGLSSSKSKSLEQSILQYNKAHGTDQPGSIHTTTLSVCWNELKERSASNPKLIPKCPKCAGELTEPRDFNLMFKTTLGALGTDSDAAYLRPETAQGMFVNFKNVCDSSRVKIPFGVAQIGKSFRNEITPRNFTFRSREFEQMEMEFFCHPSQSLQWYQYWRDRRFQWYIRHGISQQNLILREHAKDELSHYSVGTADVEYAFPFLDAGEYGELEGIAHRGDFDLRSHSEGKLCKENGQLVVEKGPDGKPKYQGSGKDLSYFDDQSRERFVPHVIEPAAGCDRATLAFLCEAYHEDQAPDEKGEMQTRLVLRLHPKLAPVKVAVFPLIKKDGMPEKAAEIYRSFKQAGIAVTYDQQAAIGRRYRRMDEIGTPFCVTVDSDTMSGDTVTVRDRDSLKQDRVSVKELVNHIQSRLRG